MILSSKYARRSSFQLPRALARGKKLKNDLGFSPIFNFLAGLKSILTATP